MQRLKKIEKVIMKKIKEEPRSLDIHLRLPYEQGMHLKHLAISLNIKVNQILKNLVEEFLKDNPNWNKH